MSKIIGAVAGLKAKVESRFGLPALGNHDVIIIDCIQMKASQTGNLDDSGKMSNIKAKDNFDPAFDQDIIVLVYQNEEGNVIIDRRSEKGWLTVGEEITLKDGTKQIVDAAFMAAHGLVATGGKITRKGVGYPSVDKTNSCVDITARILGCAGIDVLEDTDQLIGAKLNIDVVVDEYVNEAGQKGRKVGAYHKYGYVKIVKGNAHAAASKSVVAPAVEAEEDDMPF